MANVKQLADSFVTRAKQDPRRAPQILRQAANTFMGLAQDPQNAHAAKKLSSIALDFAQAASARRVTVDDFTDLLRETQEAYEQTDDPMDLVAARREIHEERNPPTPGSISIAPESFNRDATLGRSAVIKYNPSAQDITEGILQSQNVAFWQGVKKEAQAMTVDVNLGQLPPRPTTFDPVDSINVRPYGEVEYGSDGNRTKIKFDLSFGVRLTVVGNYVAVTVGMDPPRQGSSTSQLTVGASIGAFAAPSQAPLICTGYIDDLDPAAESDYIQIPLKAAVLLPIQSGLAVGENAQGVIYSYGGEPLTRFTYVQANNSPMQAIPLYGDAAFIRLKNNGLGQGTFRLPFQLAM